MMPEIVFAGPPIMAVPEPGRTTMLVPLIVALGIVLDASITVLLCWPTFVFGKFVRFGTVVPIAFLVTPALLAIS